MYHKFKDYNKSEQREIVFEIIRQKYMHDQQLNNFGNNCKFITSLIRSFCQNNKIDSDKLKEYFDDFHSKVKKNVEDEVLFYFYNIVEGLIEKADPATSNRYSIFNKMIEKFINVDSIRNTIEPPEDKISSVDKGSGGEFSMVGMNKYPAPSSYTPPPVQPAYASNFPNPYASKKFDSICDYVRYKIFENIIDEKVESISDLENISTPYLIPDSDEFINFPQVKLEDEDGEEDEYEDLDFENWGKFIINNENSITFSGGGDWQEPKEFSMKMVNGKVKAFDIHDDYDEGGDGSEEIVKIICKLFGLKKKNYDTNSEDPNDLVNLHNDMVKNKDFKLPLPVSVNLRTEDCVEAIIDFFLPDESLDFLNPKNWKRKSKTGSGIFTRMFENKVTKDIVKVTSTKSDIISIELASAGVKTFSQSVSDPIEQDFPFKEVLLNVTIYRATKEVFYSYRDFDEDEVDGYDEYIMDKGTVIAICDPDGDDGNVSVSEIIKFTKDTTYYSHEGEGDMTSDDTLYFKVSKDKVYNPASEPVDLIPDYENGGGEEIGNKKEIKKMVKKYNLSHILLSV